MRIALCLAVMIVLGSPALAHAYQRATVEDAPDRGLFWADRTIDVELAADSAHDVSALDLRAALGRSLATWSEPSCSDVVLVDVGDALGLATNLLGGRHDGLNRIVVREDAWPDDVGPETLALTSIAYERSTGRILDADIDLNAVSHAFAAATPVPVDRDDVESTLTHELGHLLGFAHVEDPEATMFSRASLGESLKRDLAPDDRDALCETYPTDAPTPAIVLPPPAGCSVGGRRTPGLALAALAYVIARARAVVRSRRRARAA